MRWHFILKNLDKTNFGNEQWLDYDSQHIWHPYSRINRPEKNYPVVSANRCSIKLADGRVLVDGMSSWWAVIHGYNHPHIVTAIQDQATKLCHIMFGGFTHQPAIELGKKLIEITPENLQQVFFSDSGSVSIEVALKMAIQYQKSIGENNKNKFLTIRGGYHGDTFGAMSVCDPVTGMHALFSNTIPQQIFSSKPKISYNSKWNQLSFELFEKEFKEHKDELAGIVLEPVVQGAGGMWFYHPEFLNQVERLLENESTLLIVDEIATGFGRTGKMFAIDHTNITPDIMCLGKALTGGHLSLAATLTSKKVSQAISQKGIKTFMHGPTFMANPIACAAALASLELLGQSNWQKNVGRIEKQLTTELSDATHLKPVKDVRVLGAIGVVELEKDVDLDKAIKFFVSRGVWIRPFKNLLYLMPPYIIDENQLSCLSTALIDAVKQNEI